jgi:hypothetical protein
MAMQWIKENATGIKVVIAVVLTTSLIIAWQTLLTGTGEYEKFTYGYYYDLETHKIFVDDKYLVPPIRDGGAVKVVVFTCGSCEDKDKHTIGWLEKYDDQAKKMLEQASQQNSTSEPVSEQRRAAVTREMVAGQLIAPDPKTTGNDVQWVLASSGDGAAIMRAVRKKCGKSIKFCSPGDDQIP